MVGIYEVQDNNWMQSLKIINASHASSIYKYMNTKLKLLNCNANIYFNIVRYISNSYYIVMYA
jgi:hypothetical protein